jgi:hypothetical protein
LLRQQTGKHPAGSYAAGKIAKAYVFTITPSCCGSGQESCNGFALCFCAPKKSLRQALRWEQAGAGRFLHAADNSATLHYSLDRRQILHEKQRKQLCWKTQQQLQQTLQWSPISSLLMTQGVLASRAITRRFNTALCSRHKSHLLAMRVPHFAAELGEPGVVKPLHHCSRHLLSLFICWM